MTELGAAGEVTDRRRLELLVEEARGCSRCPAMHGRPRVLGEGNGRHDARCLVVAEAPGPRGAGRTGVPLHGDLVGDHFERLLDEAGIDRTHLFVTNAVLCSPGEGSRPRRPTRAEVVRCTRFVRGLLEILDPALVVTLGATALSSLDAIRSHTLTLRHGAGEVHRWSGRFVLPLYHPSSRAMIHRPWADQLRDYALWRSLLPH